MVSDYSGVFKVGQAHNDMRGAGNNSRLIRSVHIDTSIPMHTTRVTSAHQGLKVTDQTICHTTTSGDSSVTSVRKTNYLLVPF